MRCPVVQEIRTDHPLVRDTPQLYEHYERFFCKAPLVCMVDGRYKCTVHGVFNLEDVL